MTTRIGQPERTDKDPTSGWVQYLGAAGAPHSMLRERLTDPARLKDRRYVAEPKLDGWRTQLHIHPGRTAAGYSRRGLDLLRHAGMPWLRAMV